MFKAIEEIFDVIQWIVVIMLFPIAFVVWFIIKLIQGGKKKA